MSRFVCPFCMEKHNLKFCSAKNKDVPRLYREAKTRNLPVFYVLTIGFSGHGKTCFLSSLFYSLYHNLTVKWPGFSFLGLNQVTLDKIHREYVNILADLKVPAKTPIMFPEPLLIKMQKFPVKDRYPFINKIRQKESVFVFYDIGGGTFEIERKMEENLPILKFVPSLLLLIDLPGLIGTSDASGIESAERNLHSLVNIIINIIQKFKLIKKKNLILAFTKADLMLKKESLYGPLATWQDDIFEDDIPVMDNLTYYTEELLAFSGLIEEFFSNKFPIVYNTLSNNFKYLYFSVFSALGHNPVKGMLEFLEPARIFDPLFFTMLSEKYL